MKQYRMWKCVTIWLLPHNHVGILVSEKDHFWPRKNITKRLTLAIIRQINRSKEMLEEEKKIVAMEGKKRLCSVEVWG